MPRHPTESHPTDKLSRTSQIKRARTILRHAAQCCSCVAARSVNTKFNAKFIENRQIKMAVHFHNRKGCNNIQTHPVSLFVHSVTVCEAEAVKQCCCSPFGFGVALLRVVSLSLLRCRCRFSRASVRTKDRLSLTKQDSIHWGLKSRHRVTQRSTLRCCATKCVPPTHTALRNEVHFGIQCFGTRSTQAFIQDPSTGDSAPNAVLRNIAQHCVAQRCHLAVPMLRCATLSTC